MRHLVGGMALLCSVLVVDGCAEKPQELPKWTAPVLDQAGIIPPADEQLMNKFVAVLEKRTGAQIAVYTVSTLGGQDPAMLATQTAERWGVGNKEKDNGILVLVAPADRKDFTATGRGVEGVLPDSLLGSLRREVLVPAFKAGDYGGGLRQYLYELGIRVASESEKQPGELSKDFAQLLGVKGATPIASSKTRRSSRRKQHWGNWVVLALIFLFMVGGGMKGRRRYGFWGAMMMTGMGGRSRGRSSGGFGGGFGGGGGSFGGGGAGGSW